jgi:hypothetical protein
MANSIQKIPFQVVEADEYRMALAALTEIARAFQAGGWNFMQACQDAANTAFYDALEV